MFVIKKDFVPESFLDGTEFHYDGKFKDFFDSLKISDVYFSDIDSFALTSFSTNYIFSIKKNGDTFKFLLSSLHNGSFYRLSLNKLSSISFERMIEDYIEHSELEAILEMFTTLKKDKVNLINNLFSYFNYKIAQQQELITREAIKISTLKLITVNTTSQKEEVLKASLSNGTKNFTIHFKPFFHNHIYSNFSLSNLVSTPNFMIPYILDKTITDEERRIFFQNNSFIENVKMKVLEAMVYYQFIVSIEYKMKVMYGDEFANQWKIRRDNNS
jgi:hypothetical protein